MRSGFTSTIQDDSGAEVPLWMPRSGDGGGDGVPAEVRARLSSALDQQEGRGGGRLSLLWLPVVISFVVLANSGTQWPIYLSAAAMMIVIVLVQRRSRWAAMAREIRSTLLGTGYCASCGYDLRGVPAGEEEGLVRCPECRAAWRLPSVPAREREGEDGEASAAIGMGDRPAWKRGVLGRMLEDAGLGFLLVRGSYSVLDDRGRAVEVVYPWIWRRPPSCWGEIPAERQRAIQRRLCGLGRAGRWLSVALGVVVLMAALMMLARWTLAGMDVLFGIILLIWAAALLLGSMLYPNVRDRRKVVDIMLAYQRCASCAADLADVAPDSDGVQECPRCRGAWRADPDAAVMRWVRWEEERRAGKKPKWKS